MPLSIVVLATVEMDVARAEKKCSKPVQRWPSGTCEKPGDTRPVNWFTTSEGVTTPRYV